MMEDDFNEKEYAILYVHQRIGEILKNWKENDPHCRKMTDSQKVKVQEAIDEYVELIFKLVTPVQIDI